MDEGRLLVSVDLLRDYAARALAVIDTDEGACLRALAAAQGALRAYLGYDPLAHAATWRVRAWRAAAVLGDADPSWEAPAPPYAFAVATTGITLAQDLGAAPRLVLADGADAVGRVTLYLGFRGAHHELADVQALPGLSGLLTLPPEVPGELVAALCEAAILAASRAASGTIGQRVVEQDLGTSTTRVTAFERGEQRRIFDTYAHGWVRRGGLA